MFKFVRQNRSRKEEKILRSARVRKEAAKLWEYVQVVERSLQAAEILQGVSRLSTVSRTKQLSAAGLTEVRRVTVSANGIVLTVSALKPCISTTSNDTISQSLPRFEDDELVVAVTWQGRQANDSAMNLLRVLTLINREPPLLDVPLKGVGFAREELSLQPSLFRLAQRALDKLADLLAPPSLFPSNKSLHQNGLQSTIFLENATSHTIFPNSSRDGYWNATFPDRNSNVTISKNVSYPSSVRFLGYSVGGSVAAYMAMILDGAMNISLGPSLVQNPPWFKASAENASHFAGLFRGRVSCLCLGPQPCVSRAVIPRSVVSVACGDDAVVRATSESVAELTDKLERSLKARAGKGSFGRFISSGSSWLGEVSDLAGN